MEKDKYRKEKLMIQSMSSTGDKDQKDYEILIEALDVLLNRYKSLAEVGRQIGICKRTMYQWVQKINLGLGGFLDVSKYEQR